MTRTLLSLFLCLSVALVGYAQEETFVFSDIVVDRSAEQAIFPAKAISQGIHQGGVDVIVEIDPEGTISDLLVLASTDDIFVSNALRSIESYQYTPAVLDGKSIWMSQIVRINFDMEGMVTPMNPPEKIEKLMNDKDHLEWTKTFSELKDLDQIPQPLRIETPVYPDSLNDQKLDGVVVVKFYIDINGKVRTPRIMSMSHPAFIEPVIKALHQWRFQAPKRDGKPVIVEVMQPFEFHYKDAQ